MTVSHFKDQQMRNPRLSSIDTENVTALKKRQSASNGENSKKSTQAQKDESKEAEDSSRDSDLHQHDVSIYDDVSSLESESYSESIESASSIPCQDKLAKLAEIVIDFDMNFNEAKNKRKLDVEEVLKAEIALRNTSGGVIRINSTHKPAVKDRDDWMKELYEKRKTLLGSECGEKDSIDDILDIETKDATTSIFVRKSSVTILTDDSHLRQRSEGRNYKVSLYSRICELLNKKERRCVCANNPKFHTSFRLDEKLSYETMTEEHKLLNPNKDENLAKRLCDKLSDNVVAFANTQGGTVYFGIEDKQSLIKGQKIKDNEEKDNIHRSIVECMERKLWALDSGEEVKPKAGDDYHIKFFRVDGAGDDTYVITVHICAFPGTAVFKQKPECSVLDQENQIVNMEFKEWLSLHKPTSGGDENDLKKLKRQICERTVYYTVEDSIEDIYSDLIEGSPGRLKIRQKYAMNSRNRSLKTFINCLKKMFIQNKWEGIVFIERCWEVNIGLPNTKPAEVIQDILVCSPSIPLLLVSLCEGEATSESCKYNIKLATKLKGILAQEGGCMEKFYVKPITLACSVEDDIGILEMISHTSVYPEAYQMSTEKYQAIVKALVPVLARVNSSFKGTVGNHLFHLLTKKQYEILFENLQSPKLMITGPPGSGKTVLAIERIHRLRRQGFSSKQVLFMCSNKVLEAEVRNMEVIMDGKSEPLCLVYNYYGIIFCLKKKCVDELAGVKHILIDEFQNFKRKSRDIPIIDWWRRFIELYDNKSPPSLWIFSDTSQQIIKGPCVLETLPDGFSQCQLSTVIRTTRKIHRFIFEKFMKNGPRNHIGHDFDGENVKVLVPRPSRVSRKVHLVYMLIHLLKDMVNKGVDPDTIGVLFTDEKEKNLYRKLFDERTRYCPVKDGKAVSEHGIVFDTIRVFSRGGKDIIIGFCPLFAPNSGFQNKDALMISLCSQAKLKLILILENEKVAHSFGLANCMENTDIPWEKDVVIIDFRV
ncbi:schlafen family member 9-like [Actinia tenebrosa]|uniref:Schlafen family member 9-like n=1 Tax=Actinia tenebrosa TaxID=6105 RepID=A0A6P8IQG0_ACTTE|nr:schlafen family member 9-like [Actinia tenebrosa]